MALVLGGVVLLAYFISSYSSAREGLEVLGQTLTNPLGPLSEAGPYAPMSHSVGGNAQPTEALQSRHPSSASTYNSSVLSSAELLPKGELGASWASVNPESMGDLKGQNFLDAGYHASTAVSGVSQSNRNPSYDVRAETPNPQKVVGPWNESTITPSPFKRGIPV